MKTIKKLTIFFLVLSTLLATSVYTQAKLYSSNRTYCIQTNNPSNGKTNLFLSKQTGTTTSSQWKSVYYHPNTTFKQICFSPDEQYLAYATQEDGYQVLQLVDLKKQYPMAAGFRSPSPIYKINFSPNSQYLLVQYEKQISIFLDPQSLYDTFTHQDTRIPDALTKRKTFTCKSEHPMPNVVKWTISANQELIGFTLEDKTFHLCKQNGTTLLQKRFHYQVIDFKITSNTGCVAVILENNNVQVFDTKKNNEKIFDQTYNKTVQNINLSPDKKHIALVFDNQTVHLLETQTQQKIAAAALCAPATRLLLNNDKTMLVHDTSSFQTILDLTNQNYKEILRIKPERNKILGWNRQGNTLLVYFKNNYVSIYDITPTYVTPKILLIATIVTPFNSWEISKDKQFVRFNLIDNSIKIIDLHTKKCILHKPITGNPKQWHIQNQQAIFKLASGLTKICKLRKKITLKEKNQAQTNPLLNNKKRRTPAKQEQPQTQRQTNKRNKKRKRSIEADMRMQKKRKKKKRKITL